MNHLKLFESFTIGLLRSERELIESEWGLTIENLEDILLELSDWGSVRVTDWYDIEACEIKIPSHLKRVRIVQDRHIRIKIVPELIVLSRVINCDFQKYKSYVNSIIKRLSIYDINVEDKTLEHSLTRVDEKKFFICLRLISNKDLELMKVGKINAFNEGLMDIFKSKKIKLICKRYGIQNYTINSKGLVDIDGDLDLMDLELTKLPLEFGRVTGHFSCANNRLSSLKGAPQVVNGSFDCRYNQLTSLEGSPRVIGGGFDCSYNLLTSLKGAPQSTGRSFDCSNNQLTSLIGSPQSVGVGFYCNQNQLTSLEGSPKVVDGVFSCSMNQLTSLVGGPEEVGGFYCHSNELVSIEGCPKIIVDDTAQFHLGEFDISNNPIDSIYSIFRDKAGRPYSIEYNQSTKDFISSMDYNYLRGNNIIKSRFKEMCLEYDILSHWRKHGVGGYNYI